MKLRIEGTEQEIKDWLDCLQSVPLREGGDTLAPKKVSKFYPNNRGNTNEGRVYADLK